MSEAIAALGSRIAVKDKECNEVLVIACGLVDGYGYTCPADQSIFQLLQEALQRGTSVLPPKTKIYTRNLGASLEHAIPSTLGTSADLPWIPTPV
jgi:hypothetical protein